MNTGSGTGISSCFRNLKGRPRFLGRPSAESDPAAAALAADSAVLNGRPRFLGFGSEDGAFSEGLNGRPRFFGVRLGISTAKLALFGGLPSRGVEEDAGLGASDPDLLSSNLRKADSDTAVRPRELTGVVDFMTAESEDLDCVFAVPVCCWGPELRYCELMSCPSKPNPAE